MRVLVLGAACPLGGELVHRASAAGHQVGAVVDRSDGGARERAALPRVTWLEVGSGDEATLTEVMRGQEVVVLVPDLALERPATWGDDPLKEAVSQVRRVLRAARAASAPSVLYVGSASALGRGGEAGEAVSELDTFAALGEARVLDACYAAETEVLAANTFQMHTASLLTTVLVGGDARGSVWERLSQTPRLWDVALNVVDVRDVANTIVKGLRSVRSGQRYAVSGHTTQLARVLKAYAEATGRPAPALLPADHLSRRALRRLLAHAHRLPQADVMRQWAAWEALAMIPARVDRTKARAELHHKARPLATTLREAFEGLASP